MNENIKDERPDVLNSATLKDAIFTSDGDRIEYALTLTYKDFCPYELFIDCRNPHYSEFLTALSVLVSRMLRAGFELDVIVSDLFDIHSPVTGHFCQQEYIPSLMATIGKQLYNHNHCRR